MQGKKKALVCEDFHKAAAWTQTTLFPSRLPPLLKKNKKPTKNL